MFSKGDRVVYDFDYSHPNAAYLLECGPKNNGRVGTVERLDEASVLVKWDDQSVYIPMARNLRLIDEPVEPEDWS